jgi:hypothetical protein
MKTALAFAIVFCAVGLLESRGENPPAAPTHELIQDKPAAPATRPAHQLSYRLEDGSENWDPDIRARIVKAMDEAVAIYNANGKFDRVVPVVYGAGTPTADASYNGQIRFGGQIGTRTALHELGHIMGVGTHPNWSRFAVDGKWTGEYALKILHDLDGPDAVLHCDRQHIWPYGLNYENEGGAENFVKHVKMIQAIRVDLGIEPPPPTTAPLTAVDKARIALAEARAQRDEADRVLASLKRGLQSSLDANPQVVAAVKTAQQAKTSYDQSIARALKSLNENADYRAAKSDQLKAQQQLDALREDNNSSFTQRSAAAKAVMTANTAVSAFESTVLSTNAEVSAAKSAHLTAAAALTTARQSALDGDTRYVAAKHAADEAHGKLLAAEGALADAQKNPAVK